MDDRYHRILHFDSSLDDLTFIQGMENQKTHFLTNFSIDLGEIWYAASTFWFVEDHTKIISYDYFQGGNFAYMILWKYTFHICLHWNTCELIRLKLGILLDMT